MKIIAHRGASVERLENTLPAIDLAWQQNTDAVEVDVQLTADGEIVVFHDDSGLRLAGADWTVEKCSWTFLEQQTLQLGTKQAKIPLLESVLRTIPDGKQLVVELKSAEPIVYPLVALVEQLGLQPEQLEFISLLEESIIKAKELLPAFHCQRVFEFEGNWPPPQKLLDYARRSPLDGLDLEAGPYVDQMLIGALHKLGKKVYVWTVNDVSEARRLQAAGLDGLTTDRPGRMKQALGD